MSLGLLVFLEEKGMKRIWCSRDEWFDYSQARVWARDDDDTRSIRIVLTRKGTWIRMRGMNNRFGTSEIISPIQACQELDSLGIEAPEILLKELEAFER